MYRYEYYQGSLEAKMGAHDSINASCYRGQVIIILLYKHVCPNWVTKKRARDRLLRAAATSSIEIVSNF